MEWTDQAIVLGTRRLGESSVVLELMTAERGRHLGVVRGGRSRRLAAVLQPGNHVHAVWRARIDEHLGLYAVEAITLRAARLIDRPETLFALQTLTGHLRLLAERESHPGLYRAVNAALDSFAAREAPSTLEIAGFIARFELALLDELGFGLDLDRCAVTGSTQDLGFVSPRTGRAVSRAAAIGYEERLLPLARFLIGERGSNDRLSDLHAAFRLTGHFLHRDIYLARGIKEPSARQEFLARALSSEVDAGSHPEDATKRAI